VTPGTRLAFFDDLVTPVEEELRLEPQQLRIAEKPALRTERRVTWMKKPTTRNRRWTVREPKPPTKQRPAGPKPWVDPLPPAERMERNRKAAALLREWMADDSGYDEEMWPVLEQALKEDPIRFREDA